MFEPFRRAIEAAGLTPPPEIIPDGKIHRFPSNGKRGDDAGWYALHGEVHPTGSFGDWRSGISANWHAGGIELTPEQRAEHRARVEAARREREAEEAKQHAVAASKAVALWKAAKPASQDHPYLRRKGVAPTNTLREIDAHRATGVLGYAPVARGEKLEGRLVVAPVKISGTMSTCELIDEAGRKSAIAGGAKKGGLWAAQPLPAGNGEGLTLLIGEGVATMLSTHEATGNPAFAALSCGNLRSVAETMRERYPAATIVVLADITKKTDEPNPHAVAAAKAVGGKLAVPDFGENRPEWATDFNDLAQLHGPEAVRAAIDKSTEVSQVSGVQPTPAVSFADTPSETPKVSEVSVPDNAERPAFRCFDARLDYGGMKYRAGVWYFGTDKNGEPVQHWICSPLRIEAVTFDGQSNNFGRLLRFRNTLGQWRAWAMPMEMLAGDGAALRAELLAMGLEIDPTTKARNQLASYLQATPPGRRMRCALQVGWCGDAFVLPDKVVGPGAANVIFQSGERGHEEYTTAGTLDGWKAEVAARAVGNPLLLLAISSALVGPMLGRCNAESGGLHFHGSSSTGKTTGLEGGASVWGGPGYRRSWRATANGMEGAAALFNDGLLALDEISECDPREVGAIVYALANGRGKQRASRTGNARNVNRWRCFVLSTGERTIATTMHEGGHRTKAGQAVRLLDIPAARNFGMFDDLHDFPSGAALADAIKRGVGKHHGHAGRAFLERLTHDTRDFCAYLERIKGLPDLAAVDGEGQDKRAAARFALIALAGELATEYGITSWPEGGAIEAAALGFKLWQDARGKGNDERRQILESVSAFIERHGDSRFSNADVKSGQSGQSVRDRAGWWRYSDTGREYLFTASGMKEALKGHDFRPALDILQAVGVLPPPGADGKRARFFRIHGRGIKLYTIQPDKLGGYHGA